MSSITIPLHLLIPTVTSLGCLIFLLLKRNMLRRKNPALYKSGLIFFFSYALVVGNALGHDVYYQWDLNRYDLNQDGLFSQKEASSAQALAMERRINDTSRNFSVISGFIVSIILSGSVFILMKISNALFGSEVNEDKNNHLNNIHTY